MSQSDVWVSDSDSEVDLDGRANRIAAMESRYLAGRDLFIMSASIKGELQNNPWARKRKRLTKNETIDNYYSAKKSVQSSAIRTQQKTLTNTTDTADRDRTSLAQQTPVWDQASCKPPQDNATKPTARLIDFRQYNSQAPELLIPRTETTRQVCQPHNSTTGLSHTPETRSPSRVLLPGEGSPSDVPHIQGKTTSSMQGLVSVHTIESPQLDDQTNVHAGDVVAEETPSRPTAISIGATRGIEHGPDLNPSPSSPHDLRKKPEPVSSVSSKKFVITLAQHDGHDSSPDHAMNTQAELASARRGLIRALQSDTSASESNSIMEHSNVEGRLESSPIAKDADTSVERQPGMMLVDTADRVPASSPSRTELPQAHSALEPVLEPTTPPSKSKTTRENVLNFAQFQSPIATQNSFLTFGSPLTFSPERPAKHSATRHGRFDQTIDDIHKYLDESTFDVVDEAKRMMSDDQGMLGKDVL